MSIISVQKDLVIKAEAQDIARTRATAVRSQSYNLKDGDFVVTRQKRITLTSVISSLETFRAQDVL